MIEKIKISALIVIMVAVLGPICFYSCTGRPDGNHTDGRFGDIDTLYNPTYAKRFILLKNNDTIILKVKDPWQGAKSTQKSYYITSPYNRIIAMSTSHLAFLDAIDCSSKVMGVSGKNYINSKSYQGTLDVGYDKHLDFERILGIKPDVMFVYEVSGESSSIFNKLISLGINIVYIADYLESNPLGRAEWIVAFGAMTGELEKSIEFFENIESNYNQLKASTKKTGKKIILNSPYQDVWYFPGTESYPVKLIEDAGGEYAGKDYHGENSVPVGIETAYRIIRSSDIWLNPSIGTNSKKDLTESNPRLNGIRIPVFNNDKHSTHSGGSDYYEKGVVRPDLILKDLTEIIQNSDNINSDSLYFYRQIL